MNPRSLPKPPLMADAAFGIALAVLYLGFVLAFQGIQSEISILFLASYALLGLGTLFFYLIFSTNSNLALIIHTWLFPLFCLLNLFLRWLPSVIVVGRAEINTFFGSVLIYVLLLFAFFVVQSNLRTRYRPSE
ncbi:MAG: hypothetical protein AVW05_03635 [Hadesarchaea archaeon DG-33]|nr:MAG: hypothetical protein AVW05_03635 [Hadesarchaea archaeon DG-33]